MKIFVFSPSYPNPKNPVANIFVKEQVKALTRLGHQIIVLTVQKELTKNILKKLNKSIYQTVDDEIIIYCSQKTFYEAKLHQLNQYFLNHTFSSLYSYALVHYGKPDVIYAHFMSASYAAAALEPGIPIVTFEHSGNLMKNTLSVFERKCLKKVVANSQSYIVPSEKLKNAIIKITHTDKMIYIVPNMINEIFTYYPYPPSACFPFFSLCRLEYDKRIDLLIEAFCIAFGKDENVLLRIGGTGKEYKAISRLIRKKKRGHQIKLLGSLNREETLKQYQQCACFVLASRHETFGMVWREALCVGRPIITTNHGGFSPDDFNEKYGLIIKVDDKNGLAQALKLIKKKYDHYNLREISHENISRYSLRVIIKKIEGILLEAIKK